MLNYLKYRYHLYLLNKSSRKLSKQFLSADKRVQNKGQYDYIGLQDISRQQNELQTWIEYIQTKYYQKKCNVYIIPMPEKDDLNYYQYNFDDNEGEREILTIEGFHYVRRSIRNEKKERRESFGFWVTVVTGLLGALIGVISIIKT